MSTELQENRAIEVAVTKIELIEGLQAGIDRKYRRLPEAARADWEHRFAGIDPSDTCVSVRVAGEEIQRPPPTYSRFRISEIAQAIRH